MTRVRTVAAVAVIAALAFGLNLACAPAAAFLVHGVVPPPATPEWPGGQAVDPPGP
jgi:hypothetical protein